jgi:hypothetical protein
VDISDNLQKEKESEARQLPSQNNNHVEVKMSPNETNTDGWDDDFEDNFEDTSLSSTKID